MFTIILVYSHQTKSPGVVLIQSAITEPFQLDFTFSDRSDVKISLSDTFIANSNLYLTHCHCTQECLTSKQEYRTTPAYDLGRKKIADYQLYLAYSGL